MTSTIIYLVLTPICFLTAWSLLGLCVLTLCLAIQDVFNAAKIMHQIPCVNCQFFTGSYYLKCAVHPSYALTESAINCRDLSLK